jgi:XTP/dITP diphosphohydrolase
MASCDLPGHRLLELVSVMDRLRRECPWDREQTHLSLVRYLVEETYETVEAIESGDRDHLREELGDLLLQVMFHARIATEAETEPFGIDEVAEAIVAKMVRRHPHVFAAPEPGGSTPAHDLSRPAGVQSAWDEIKAAEKSRTSSLDGIPLGLPALSLAAAVAGRAVGAGFAATTPDVAVHDERSLGDLLFAIAAAANAAGLDAEQALRQLVRREMTDVRVREQRGLRDARDQAG